MIEALRERLSYANVTATIALFLALGGSSYAVSKIGGRDIADNSIESRDIRDGSLLPKDFRRLPPRRARRAQATSGASNGAGAYGRVYGEGSLGRSQNVVAPVRNPRAGVYCITLASGISPWQSGAVATPDYSSDATSFTNTTFNTTGFSDKHAVIEWDAGSQHCGGALEIRTGVQYGDGRIQPSNQGFFFSVPPRQTGPRATALVYPGGDDGSPRFEAAYTKGFTAVSGGGPLSAKGILCLTPPSGIDPASNPATVTVAHNYLTHAFGNRFLAMWSPTRPACEDNEYEVRTFDFSGDRAQPSNRVPFLITVP